MLSKTQIICKTKINLQISKEKFMKVLSSSSNSTLYMSNLKEDLDSYLLLQSDKKKHLNMKVSQINFAKSISEGLGKIFPQSEESVEANGWLQDTQETCFPKLSRVQRIVGFLICLSMGGLCMTMSTFYIPILILKARKFGLIYTLGSVFCILSFCFLSGFRAFLSQMFSETRQLSSCMYSICLMLTLYSALIAQSTALTVIFAIAQIIVLLSMVVSMIPGGSSGIKLFSKLFKSKLSANTTLPV